MEERAKSAAPLRGISSGVFQVSRGNSGRRGSHRCCHRDEWRHVGERRPSGLTLHVTGAQELMFVCVCPQCRELSRSSGQRRVAKVKMILWQSWRASVLNEAIIIEWEPFVMQPVTARTYTQGGYFMLDVDMHFYPETSPPLQHSALWTCQMWLKNMKNFPQLSPKNHGNGAVKLISRRYFNISLYERHLKFPQQQFPRPVLALDEQETVALSRCSSGDVHHVCTETRSRTPFRFCKIICHHCSNSQCWEMW